MSVKRINSEEGSVITSQIKSMSVLGTFEGECADANITNNNGLDITRPVWEAVFSSEDYKQAIELGWYIGFLGHPEDPNCMDFRNACIVMREGHIDEDGKVRGKFDLLDTPVGRVVKTFIDAGVQFGISVRGVGDITDNSVEPETFIFRGFDLVTFPAFPNAIPSFSAIAASSDAKTQQTYKVVCSTVSKNISDITSASAIETIQKEFAAQSKEYADLEKRKNEILSSTSLDEQVSYLRRRLDSVMQLYLNQVQANTSLRSTLDRSETNSERRLKVVERITASQIQRLDAENSRIEGKYRTAVTANSKLKKELEQITNTNLKYKQKIDASTQLLRSKEAAVSRLENDLAETVSAKSESESRTSNLDAQVAKLKSQIQAATKLIREYQEAYGSMYATALGVNLENISFSISDSTSVQDLKSKITAATNTSGLSVNPEVLYDIEEVSDPDNEDDIVYV